MTLRPAKRSLSAVAQGPLTEDRIAEFNEVFQNGQAEPKYIIIKYRDYWYILECKEHNMHFQNKPMRTLAVSRLFNEHG